MRTEVRRHDVVVVGARAAGAATALLLARMGHDVVVVDRTALPSDTVSTHQIARSLPRRGESVTRTIKHMAGVDFLVAPRRNVVDTVVAEAADGAGADVRHGIAVCGVRLDDAGRATGVYAREATGAPIEIAARFVVGADGLNSRAARSVGVEVVEDRGDNGAAQYA